MCVSCTPAESGNRGVGVKNKIIHVWHCVLNETLHNSIYYNNYVMQYLSAAGHFISENRSFCLYKRSKGNGVTHPLMYVTAPSGSHPITALPAVCFIWHNHRRSLRLLPARRRLSGTSNSASLLWHHLGARFKDLDPVMENGLLWLLFMHVLYVLSFNSRILLYQKSRC